MSIQSGDLWVKICGVRSERDIQTAAKAGADAVGILCSVPIESPRRVEAERARELVAATPESLTSVLVTMPAGSSEAIDLLETVEPDVIQLHGELSPIQVARIVTECPVIRAFDVTALEEMKAAADHVDAVLIDSTDEQGAGGTGETHDWQLARSRVTELDIPVILAGGLTPDNVAAAVEQVQPFGVDVASGVDGDEGKDAIAVHQFVERARSVTPSAPGWSYS